ncbi:MAG: phosphate signaling complex protein PhoU [Nitrospirae bacterium]|nr:phosphate signaling complex protein PhoU [Nitrospirota bacterium]
MSDIAYEIKNIKDSIIDMSVLVETSIKNAVLSLVNNDAALGRMVIRNDHLINSYCLSIDEDCIRLISSKKPMCRNLRFITTAIKLVFDLERIADNAVKIAERDLDINLNLRGYPQYVIEPQIRDNILSISEIVLSLLRDTIESFVKEERFKAMNVTTMIDKVDKLHNRFMDELMIQMIKSPDPIYCAARISYVARYLEKIGEHSINLAELVIDLLDGQVVNNYLNAVVV